MHNLSETTPLGKTQPETTHAGGLTCTEVTARALAFVACRQGQYGPFQKAMAGLLGADPPPPGRSVSATPYSAFWVGPEQWMVSADYDSHADIAAQVKQQLGDCASVSEQTDGWCIFDLKGAGLNGVLERLCNIDLAAFERGSVVRTAIQHMNCFVSCDTPDEAVRFLGPRSSARSLHHAIVTTMHSNAMYRTVAASGR